jgi:vesicle coat complex subunit
MVYLYLNQYAARNADQSVLAINTLLKDCNDVDPLVRGLALRNLTSLRCA